jgi:hypothetical protein
VLYVTSRLLNFDRVCHLCSVKCALTKPCFECTVAECHILICQTCWTQQEENRAVQRYYFELKEQEDEGIQTDNLNLFHVFKCIFLKLLCS